jgi:protein TBF1
LISWYKLWCDLTDIQGTEILKILSSHQHSTILQIVTGTPESPLSHNYSALLQVFDIAKKQLYSADQAFLDPDVLGFKQIQERKVLRKANLATFISSVFGSVDVGFFHLNEGFLATMAPDGGRLLKNMSKLFLDLKTQVLIDMSN